MGGVRERLELVRGVFDVYFAQCVRNPSNLLPVVFIATVPQGGRPSNRKLLDRVKIVLGTLYSVKKCLRLKFEKLTVNFFNTRINC